MNNQNNTKSNEYEKTTDTITKHPDCPHNAFAVEEKTDVTTSYVKNASFEADAITSLQTKTEQADGLRGYVLTAPKDWTVNNSANAVSLIVTADCYTDNNFGKVTTLADGTQAYYLRMGWSTGTTTLRQTAAQFAQRPISTGSQHPIWLCQYGYVGLFNHGRSHQYGVLFRPGFCLMLRDSPMGVATTDFELATDGDATIGFNINWVSGGSCIMFDDVHLYRLTDDYVKPEDLTETDGKSHRRQGAQRFRC